MKDDSGIGMIIVIGFAVGLTIMLVLIKECFLIFSSFLEKLGRCLNGNNA